MSAGEARKTTSCTFFETSTKKRPRMELEQSVPTITISNEPGASNANTNIDTEAVALKLNRLTDKCCRYKSHKEFLEKCKAANQIPDGLRLTLEPSIGNHDDEFLKKWYETLDECSLIFINMVTDFCDKTITSLVQEKSQTKDVLNKSLINEEYNEMISIIDANEKETKQVLHQRKTKKFNYLKYHKGKPQIQSFPPRERDTTPRDGMSYKDAVIKPRNTRDRNNSNNTTNLSNSNNTRNTDASSSKTPATFKNKLQNFNWRNQGLQRTYSNTSATSNRSESGDLRQQVANLQKELEIARKGKKANTLKPSHYGGAHLNPNNPFLISTTSTMLSEQPTSSESTKTTKNGEEALGIHQGRPAPTPKDIISYIENTMVTLRRLTVQLKEQQGSETIPPEW